MPTDSHRTFFLPRLSFASYLGDAVVHWTMPIARRQTGWLNPSFHSHFRELLLHTAARETLCCPVYCLMPDHIHLIWMGLQKESNQRRALKFLREHLHATLRPIRFQHQAHDHVLRGDERKKNAFAKICFYIIDNARAAELADNALTYPYSGCIVPGYPTLHPLQPDYWEKFWEIYAARRAEDAGEIRK